MLIDLAALWLVTWLVRTAAMDVAYAVTGKPNPRFAQKQAKARAAGQSLVQPRYGTRDWFDDLLSDGLAAQTQWRRRRAASKQARVLDHDDDQDDLGGRRDTAEVRDTNTGRDTDTDDDDERPTSVVHDGVSTSYREAGLWAWSCRRPGCPGKGFNYDNAERARDAAAEHRCPDTQRMPADGVQITGSDAPASASAGGEADLEQSPQPSQSIPPSDADPSEAGARVIPFPTKPQEEQMNTDINTEVIGLDQSIAYATSLATFAGEHATAGNEGYTAHLSGHKVGGDALRTAAEMQEAFTNAATAAAAHAAELEKQRGVQEAYDAAPDAGDKDYQTQGR